MNKTYQLPDPIWKTIVDQAPERQVAVQDRINELTAKREMIDIELELLGPTSRPSTKPSYFSQKPQPWQASLSGFHNPKKHYGLTPVTFLDLYKCRLAERGGSAQIQMFKWVEEHEQEVMTFIRERFSRTLDLKN